MHWVLKNNWTSTKKSETLENENQKTTSKIKQIGFFIVINKKQKHLLYMN